MDLNTFWGLVEDSAVESSDQYERTAWLTERLAALPPGDVADFAAILEGLRARVDTWRHWQAATLICAGLCGMDGFFYFQAWLVGQGRAVFEAVAASPDALADVPQVQVLAGLGGVQNWPDDAWPDWEALYSVADDALESGDVDELLDARGLERKFDVDPSGEDVEMEDPVDLARRVPRLWAMFGKAA